MIEAKGIGGTLIFDGNKITIKRKGVISFMSQGLKGDKDIYLNQISAIQLKRAGITNGYIQFSFLGGQESKKGIFDATRDENTVFFNTWQQKVFENIKAEIEKHIGQPVQNNNGLDELEKLAALKQKGIITEEEFKIKKKQILGI